MTKSVCLSASATLELLTRDLEPGERVEFRDRMGVHMTLHVERLADVSAGSLFTLAHAHAGHLGELICDPMVTLIRELDGSWVPLEVATPFTRMVTAEVGDPVRVLLRDEHRRLVKLVEVWTASIHVNLLSARNAFQREEVCSPAEYQTA